MISVRNGNLVISTRYIENGVAWADRHGTGKIDIKEGESADFIVDYVKVYQYK